MINRKQQTIKINLANYIDKNCFLHSMLCIKFGVESKLKNVIRLEKLLL